MMFGGGWAQTSNEGLDVVGLADDSKLNVHAASHLSGLLPYIFGSGTTTDGGRTRAWEGVQIKNMWTGVIGFSADVLPFVGKIPNSISKRGQPKAEDQILDSQKVKTGEWIAAGFSGEGMVNCWGCGTALARMVLGEPLIKNQKVNEMRVRGWKGEVEVDFWRDQTLAEWFPAEMIITKSRVDKADVAELLEALAS